MEIPEEILKAEPGIYSFTYDGYNYRVVVSETVPGNPIGITVHGGGADGGYNDTVNEQKSLLNGQTINEALKSESYEITGQNQIDIFPLEFKGYSETPANRQRVTNLVMGISEGIEGNLGNAIVYMPEGHSATSRDAIENALLYARSGGSAEQIIAFSLEPAHNTSTTYTEDDIKTMKDNNIIVLQVRGNSMCSDMQDAIDNGMPFIDVKFTLINEYGREDTSFSPNHRVPRTMLGDLDYSDIANGTFSWESAFSKDENDNYPKYYDSYTGHTYDVILSVKVYNIPGFTNGEEVPLDVLDSYMGSLVMSDEEYLISEIDNMRSAIKSAEGLIDTSSYNGSYSTTRLPNEAVLRVNDLITYNALIVNKALELLQEIENAKDSYTLVDKELYLKAIEELSSMEISTPTLVKEDPVVSDTNENGSDKINLSSKIDPSSVTWHRQSATPSREEDSKITQDDKSKLDSDKTKEDDKTKTDKEETITPSDDDKTKEDKKDDKQEEIKQEAKEEQPKSEDENKEKEDEKTDDKKITSPDKKVDKTIPSKAKSKSTTKKSTTSKTKTETNTTSSEEPPIVEPAIETEEEAIIPGISDIEEERPIYPIYEEEIDDTPIDVPVEEANEKVTSNNDANILKTVGIAAGIGAGIGAIAYGVNEQIKKKDYEDGFDYSYANGDEKSDYLEQETQTSEYSPYVQVSNDEVGPYNVSEEYTGGEE